jgi:hypothetical protein
MNVINPEIRSDVRHFSCIFLISSQKKAVAPIMAIVPMKNVKATIELRELGFENNSAPTPISVVITLNIFKC